MQDDWYILISAGSETPEGTARPPVLLRDAVGPPPDAWAAKGTEDGAIQVYRSSVGWMACQGGSEEVKPLVPGAWSEIGGWRLKLANLEDDAEASLVDRTGFLAPELHIRDASQAGGPLRRIRLPGEEQSSVIVGRGQEADIQVADHKVSRRHMRLSIKNGRWHAEDLGSLWKSFVGGAELSGSAQLRHGDEIRLGDTLLLFVNHMEALEGPARGGDSGGRPHGKGSKNGRGPAAVASRTGPESARGPATELIVTASIVLLVTGVLVYAFAAVLGELLATGSAG